jgi:hypothetical protein
MHGGPEDAFDIHHKLALMLGYLDLDYWLSPLKQTTLWNQNRIARYLERLRSDVVLELKDVTDDELHDPTFGTNVLREWAVRVKAEHGHSKTGRKEYETSCARDGGTLYEEDFILYGEHKPGHVMNIRNTQG